MEELSKERDEALKKSKDATKEAYAEVRAQVVVVGVTSIITTIMTIMFVNELTSAHRWRKTSRPRTGRKSVKRDL